MIFIEKLLELNFILIIIDAVNFVFFNKFKRKKRFSEV